VRGGKIKIECADKGKGRPLARAKPVLYGVSFPWRERMRKIRVLHLIHWPRSGIGALVGELMRLSRTDIEYHVIGFEGSAEDFCLVRDGAVSVESLNLRTRGPLALYRLQQRIASLNLDIVHTHSLQPGLWSRILTRSPQLLATVHNAYPYFTGNDLRSRMKRQVEIESFRFRPLRVTCVSDDVREVLPPGWPDSEVVNNGVVVERVREMAAHHAVMPPSGSGPLLVSAGRLESQKGYDLLLDAVAQVNRIQPVRLLIIGDGSQRKALENQADGLGLSGNVRFGGFQENPFPYIAAGDLYISSSRFEGFGLAVLEAMCLGLPAVSTATAGMGGLLQEGKTGFVATTDAKSIADAIMRALSDQTRRKQVAQRGMEWVEQRFHLKHTCRRYLEIYEEMAGPTSGRRQYPDIKKVLGGR
jgi:glycosyltransferase involved in cell wall biosynthesis